MASPESAPYVFLSYARADKLAVDRIVDALAINGIKVWRDIDDIKPGDNWISAIERGVQNARVIIFVVSHQSSKSSFTLNKLAHVIAAKRIKILPIRIDDVRSLDLPLALSSYQFTDLTNDFESGMRSILDALHQFGIEPVPQLPPPKQANKGYAFISYAKEDLHHVTSVTNFLQSKRYAYFDYKERARRFDADFDTELEDRLRSAELVTSIVTPNWKKAVWPKKEYLFASLVGVPTFLLMFEDPGPSILIVDRTPIDFTIDKAAAFAALDDQLKSRRL